MHHGTKNRQIVVIPLTDLFHEPPYNKQLSMIQHNTTTGKFEGI